MAISKLVYQTGKSLEQNIVSLEKKSDFERQQL